MKHITYKNSINVLALWVLLFGVNCYSAKNDSVVAGISRFYCNLTHPVEYFAPINETFGSTEQQHIIQQQHFGGNRGNISIISSSSHSTTDRWGGGFYSDEDSWGVTEQGRVWADRPHSGDDAWGMSEDSEKSLEQAYKLGRYQLEYCFVLYNHTGSGFDTTFLTWDGSTQLVYAVTWWVNLPSKWCRKLSYLIDKGHYRLIIDHFIQIPVLIIEGIFGTVYNLFGAVVGLFLHPVDTFCALIGGIVLVLQGIVGAIVDLVLNIINVVGVMF